MALGHWPGSFSSSYKPIDRANDFTNIAMYKKTYTFFKLIPAAFIPCLKESISKKMVA